MSNILDREITIFDSAKESKKGHKATLAEFLLMGIDRQEEFKPIREIADRVEALRSAEGSAEDIKQMEKRLRELKSLLSCATISGVFPTEREAKAPDFKHSGLISIDIDHCDPVNVMDQLKNIDFVAYASRSASGKGVFAIIPLAYPDRHNEQFCALSRMFNAMGMKLDEAPKSIASLRFISFDDQAFYRPDAVEFQGLWNDAEERRKAQAKGSAQKQPTQHHNAPSTPQHGSEDYNRLLARVQACVNEIQSRHIDICPDNEQWHAIAFSLSTLGEEGRSLFNTVAEQCADLTKKATPSENNREFDRGLAENRNISIATFFEACKQYGINGKEIVRKTQSTAPVMTIQEWKDKFHGIM